MDEATSALDRKNEEEIQKTLDQVSVGRTTIIVAHRLCTIQNADKIIVMDNGQFVEEGTHSQLLEKKGKYYELNKNQIYREDAEDASLGEGMSCPSLNDERQAMNEK